MRHNVYGKHLGRTKNQRTALFKGLIRSLVLHGAITTTESKAKAVKGLIDRVIVKSKDKSEASKNVVKSIISQKEIIEKLAREIAPRFKNRNSGFTQIVRLGRRDGDGAMLVKMILIGESEKLTTDDSVIASEAKPRQGGTASPAALRKDEEKTKKAKVKKVVKKEKK